MLISEAPFAVKLSSFELTTEILPRDSIGKIFHPQSVDDDRNLMMTVPADTATSEKYYKLSKQHFYNRTSLPTFKSVQHEDDRDCRLPYSVAYRRMFSMHYYQAPELLIPSSDANYKYVLPTTRSDTFALCLLLWEALNHCVPFVIYNQDELISAFKKSEARLPLLDKSSTAFMEIFDSCLRVNSDERLSDVSDFISMLDEIYRAGEGNKKVPEIVERVNHHKLETKKNFKNTKLSEKVPEKVYFIRSEVDAIDPQKRGENAITSENLRILGQKDSSRVSDSVRSSELEAHVTSFSQQPGILLDDALDRIRRTVEDQRVIAPKKPVRRLDEPTGMLEASRRSLTDSTMYQSFFDFNRLHTPKIDKDVIYERTSTLKKRLKAPGAREQKKSVKGLFEKPSVDEAFDKMNNELSQIVQDYNKNDFMNEIVHEIKERQKNRQDDVGLSSFLNCGMTSNIHDQSRSFDELPRATPEAPKIKRSESDNVRNPNAYRFSIGEYSLPKTPIALQNKIRRNAWLSDGKKSSGAKISDVGLKHNKSGGDFSNNTTDDGPKVNRKQYNVSIKIHRNDLDATPKQKSVNDSSINIQLYSSADHGQGLSPLVKVNNVELNSSRYNADMNKKYYPMMPEMLSDVIQNKRDRSGYLQMSHCEDDSGMDRIQVQHEVDEKVIVPVRTSVRDAIKFIESTYTKKDLQDATSPSRVRSAAQSDELFSTPTAQASNFAHEETQTEMFFTPTTDPPKNENDDVSECLTQASESIQKLNEMFQSNQPQNMPVVVNKRLESVVTQTPKKITTKVTVNLKKISRRSSDVGHLKQVQEQTRHSICNNTELIKRIQMHFRSKDQSMQIAHSNAAISASCSSLVPKQMDKTELAQPGKCSKYFCRNCGFTMLPVEVLKKLHGSGRLSIASSLAEGLQSIKYDEGSQSMAALRKCHPITVSFVQRLNESLLTAFDSLF